MRDFAAETGHNSGNAQVLKHRRVPSPRHADRSRDDMAVHQSTASPTPEVYEVRYPFVRDVYQEPEADESGSGYVDVPTWQPGIRSEGISSESGCTHNEADGIGIMRLTVVSRHRPSPKYRERVFFTREWVDPDGRTFGKTTLRMLGAQAFKTIATSFRVEYEMAKQGAAK
jgi:hypothetical protein